MFKNIFIKLITIMVLLSIVSVLSAKDLDKAFLDHGIAAPISNSRGVVATVDGEGENVVLVWLFDYRGGYALLMIDAMTGKSEQFPIPFPPNGDGPYASLLSSLNKYYTHFNNHFIEFDVAKRAFTFYRQTTIPQTAMSMTEDDNGVIWSATYPQSGVVSYNPRTGEFKDYGHVYKQNWQQYPRYIAADNKGWIYFALGYTASQIIALNPLTGEAWPMLPESERGTGMAMVYRDIDGYVYGKAFENARVGWYKFYMGRGWKIGKHDKTLRKAVITGSQGLFHTAFPDGKKIIAIDLAERRLVIGDSPARTSEDARIKKTLPEHFRVGKVTPRGSQKELHFDYSTEGAQIMSLASGHDGTIWGGTSFPMRSFVYQPKQDLLTNMASYGQWNTVAFQDNRFFIGGYIKGFLLEWDPLKAWVPTEKNKPDSNPRYIGEGSPAIDRPHKLLAYPDGKTIILAGTPDYGLTGGGLLFWDRETRKMQLLKDTEVIPEHSTMSLVGIPMGKILGGTTTTAGTGGLKKAKEAELYLMDLNSKKVLWHQAIFPGVQEYSDLCIGPDELVYGITDRTMFFVFDTEARKVVFKRDISKLGPIATQQGRRIFVTGPNKIVYILFYKGIARVEPKTHEITWLADSPVPITAGGDFFDGKIYFASGSHIYSYKVE